MPSRRTYFAWHSWIGLTFGLMLFVVCWSGTIAVFSHEIDWLLNPDLRANVAAGPVDWQAAYEAVRTARPDWTINEIYSPRYSGFAIEVLAQPEPDKNFRVYVDPVTYQVLGDTSYFNVQRFFRSFHMALFDAGEIKVAGAPLGYIAVGILGIPLLLSITLPLIFYKRWWRGFFKLERHKGAKIFWSDLHKLTGLWSIPVGLIIALTGIWYLSEWWVPEPPYFEAETPIAAPYRTVSDLAGIARQADPDLDIRSISLPQANDGLFIAYGQDGTLLIRDAVSVTLNARTGAVLDRSSPADATLYARWFDTVDMLHFGHFGGLWTQALYFIVGLGLSGLALTGAYLQAKRQQRRMAGHAGHHIRRPIVISYSVTVLLLIFAISGGFLEIKNYGPGDDWPHVAAPITLFIAAWCTSTLTALTIWMRKLT
jgi:uncharacterized iron-regulated membrane protein